MRGLEGCVCVALCEASVMTRGPLLRALWRGEEGPGLIWPLPALSPLGPGEADCRLEHYTQTGDQQ